VSGSFQYPRLLVADAEGKIYDDPDLLMLCRRGREWGLPRPGEWMPLPPESRLFLLPGRHAVGLDPESGESVEREDFAVAAFVAPAHTLTGHPVYATQPSAPVLPLFAYGAVGMIGDRFYVCARKVDEDKRQVFAGIPDKAVRKAARELMGRFPRNRLVRHLMGNCVLRYACPAARNLCLGRHEAPLPVSRSCNARCAGCISRRNDDAQFGATPQDRLTFTPSVEELVEVMLHHQGNETKAPIYSFGQGCEGEPLTEAELLVETVRVFRSRGGRGTVNLNSNASLPEVVARLAGAGLTSLRVTLNSARPAVYSLYHRPSGFQFADVRRSIMEARAAGLFVSLNLLYFPGITDCEEELEALGELVDACGIPFIQLRNLNIDPEFYLRLLDGLPFGPATGLIHFCKRLKKVRPGLAFGYFNPALPETNGVECR
jgi:pyruvate-formate lyase-activating enzyme